MANIFQHVIAKRPKRSTFDLSHDVKLTAEMGKLIPFLCEEVVPGDTWKNKTTTLVRFAPLQAPVMHRLFVTTHFFYVPFRLIWDEFEDFITGGPAGNLRPAFPTIELLSGDSNSDFYDSSGKFATGSLADYLNYPTSDSNMTGGGLHASALPLRAYQLIFDEYYRDENLSAELNIDKSSGNITLNSDEYNKLLTIRNRAWFKDYYTSALPWTQRGQQQLVPVNGTGELSVSSDIPVANRFGTGNGAEVYASNGGDPVYIGDLQIGPASTPTGSNYLKATNSVGAENGNPAFIRSGENYINHIDLDGLDVDITGGTFNINDLRKANRIQKWLERQARSGSRYIESLASHFGVISDDLRLQRPEFIGGGVNPVQISDVLQTSETTENSPQAQPAGVGFSLGGSNEFKRTFKERGIIMGILSITPVPAYSEGLPRAYRKFDKFDFYWPEFSQLGEQEVFNYELALRGNDLDGTFGYAPRFAEYKYIPSRVHGDFKTNLNFWTMNRHYSAQPTLSEEFVTIDAQSNDLNRVFAVEGTQENPIDHLWIQLHNEITARRPMPYLPDPSL